MEYNAYPEVTETVMELVFKYLCSGKPYVVTYFRDEYFLLIESHKLAKVRVYLDGSVWETNGCGDYEKV